MPVSLEALGINRLSVAERVELARAILESIPADSAPQSGMNSAGTDELAQMIHEHDLNAAEIARLLRVFWDYDSAVHKRELEEELRCVIAARELAERPPLTNETADKARAAFDSGRVPFVPQDMD